jgi:hypothetical protein
MGTTSLVATLPGQHSPLCSTPRCTACQYSLETGAERLRKMQLLLVYSLKHPCRDSGLLHKSSASDRMNA